MSGLIVRPGDTLIWSIAPPSDAGAETRTEMKRLIEAGLPGVSVVVVEGMAGGPFVYRPDPPEAERARHPLMHVEPGFMPTEVDEEKLSTVGPERARMNTAYVAERVERSGSPSELPWVHGSRLGREHQSVRQHLIEDHGEDPETVETWSDGAVHGAHDGAHKRTWAYAFDLPHPPREAK